jgi:hypothetical protein
MARAARRWNYRGLRTVHRTAEKYASDEAAKLYQRCDIAVAKHALAEQAQVQHNKDGYVVTKLITRTRAHISANVGKSLSAKFARQHRVIRYMVESGRKI